MSEISTRWYRPEAIPVAELRGLTDVFEEVADDFVPPLTSRGSTTQSDLSDRGPGAGAPGQDYLTEMLRQDVVVSRHGDRVVGFLSFRSHHQDPRYADLSPCLYVSTVAVRRSHRRHGVARALYRELFGLPAALPPWIVLRTWSTNTGHLELLGRLGFTTVLRLKDARAAGIDTVYLAADRTANADDSALPRTDTPARAPADTTT